MTDPKDINVQTYGEKLVSVTFNPSNDDLVTQLKSKYAEIINILQEARTMTSEYTELQRYISIAITESQTAQMRAVKAVTAK